MTLSKTITAKLLSWKRNGTHLPLTAQEAKKVLCANRTIDERGCWLWKLNTFGNGYGRLPCSMQRAIGCNTGRVHVLAYLLWKGVIPSGKYVCHSCDVKRCFNPSYLWPGTNRDNQLDAARKGVFARYWTKARRREKSALNSGTGNPMYGRCGASAPAFGRVGKKHPMFGKHHTEASKARISAGLLLAVKEGRK